MSADAAARRALDEAVAAHRRGDLADAARRYEQILAANPRDVNALHLLGQIRLDQGDAAKAADLIAAAVRHHPEFPLAHVSLAKALRVLNEPVRAEAHLHRAIGQDGRLMEAHSILGDLYRSQGRHAAAVAAFQSAVDLDPTNTGRYINLVTALRDTDDVAAILAATERALARLPGNSEITVLRMEALFATGRLPEAWKAYACRFTTTFNPLPQHTYPLPEWRGESFAGKRVLACREQGIGDEILYAGIYDELIAAADKCVITCEPRLIPLFRRSFPQAEVMGPDVSPDVIADLDCRVSVGDLGRWFRPTFASFPARNAYLRADPQRVQALRTKYTQGLAKPFVIGIAWRSAGVDYAAAKSLDLGQWGGIFALPGVRFVNLQYGDCAAEIAAARDGFRADIIDDTDADFTRDLDAFAAQCAAMDLVISSSNTAAHMAAALGVPVLCMLPKTLGRGRRWYWFAEQPECPWYPTVRRFVQRDVGDWSETIAEVAVAALDAAKGTVAKPLNYLVGLGKAYLTAGLWAAADHVFARADALMPNVVQILSPWAQAKRNRQQFDQALALLDRAISVEPADINLHNLRGATLVDLNRLNEAMEAYATALRIVPDNATVQNNMGTALRKLGRGREARTQYESALEAQPKDPAILFNLAAACSELGDADASLAYYDRLLAVKPGDVEALYNKAQVLLAAGRLTEGWRMFAVRTKRPAQGMRPEYLPSPVWSGELLAGKHVLIWTEQGIGDEVMAASMVADARAAARKVTLLCSERLVGLFRRAFPGVTVETCASPLPAAAFAADIDCQMSLSELGLCFRPDLSRFPVRRSFLTPEPALRARLRARYEERAAGRKIVGVSWRSANPDSGSLKSGTLADWLPLFTRADVLCVDLQYGDTSAERMALARDHGVTLFHDDDVDPVADIDAAAAQIAAMDMVVSVSNTSVHLAGALGVPTQVLLPPMRGRRWYWFRGRADSPWYPSLRLLTAPEDGEWRALLKTITV